MARSMAASRSNRQFSQCLPMISSSAPASLAAPSKSWFANSRVLSAPLALFQNFRSEEHTSELQSRGHLVCRLLLEKKKIRSLRTITLTLRHLADVPAEQPAVQ